MTTLICAGCVRPPGEIPGIVEAAEDEGLSPNDYVLEVEGTLDEASGLFLCDRCYIKAGQPSWPFPRRWTATPENLINLGIELV